MSQTVAAKETSFWREALPAIKMMMQAKWPWVVGLILILAVPHILAFIQAPSADIAAQLKADPNLFKEHPELAPHGIMMRALISFFGFLLSMIAYYVFPIFYLQIAAKASPPKPTIGGFFYWLWKSFQKNLLWIFAIVIFELAAGLVMGIFWAIFHALKLPAFAIYPIIAAGVVCIFVFSYYVYFRLYLVTPLAILRKEPVIKNSRDLTKGQCWKILCGAFVLFVMYCGIFFIPLLVLSGIEIYESLQTFSKNGVPNLTSMDSRLMLTLGLLQSCFTGILAMTSAVYECTVYRILMQEQKNNSTLLTPQSGA